MTTISKGSQLVTLINVFTRAPEHQQEVVDLLARATETSVRHAPGFEPGMYEVVETYSPGG